MIYLPAKIAEGFISIFTLSYLTGLYTTAVYGRLSSINVTIGFINIIVFSWIANAASRYSSDYLLDEDGRKKERFFSSLGVAWLFLTVLSLAVSIGAALAFSDPVLFVAGFALVGFSSFQIVSAVLVQTGKRLFYIVLSICDSAAKLAVSVLMGSSGVLGRTTPLEALIAYALSDVICVIVGAAAAGVFGRFRFRFISREAVSNFFGYGFPLIGVGFSIALLNQAYRYIIAFFSGYETFAIFSANSTIAASVFNMLMIGIMRGVYPSILKSHRERGAAGASETMGAGARLYLLVALPCAMGLTALAPSISRLILDPEKYASGIPIIGFTAFGMLFLGLTEYSNKAWELGRDTKPILFNSLISAAVNIVLNLILIPLFGFLAAGASMLVSYLLYFILSFVRGRKHIRLLLPRKMLFSLVLSSALCGAAAYLCTFAPFGSLVDILLGVLAGAAVYALALALSGEIKDELSALRSLIHKIFRRPRA